MPRVLCFIWTHEAVNMFISKENYILSIDQALAKFRAQNLDYFDIFEREVTPSFKKAQPCGRCKVCIKVNKRVCDAKRKSLQTSELRRQTHLMKEQQVTKELSQIIKDSCPLILSTRLAHQGHQGAAIASFCKLEQLRSESRFYGLMTTNFLEVLLQTLILSALLIQLYMMMQMKT